MNISVVVIDDEVLVRKGILTCMDWQQYGISIVGEAEDGRKGLELVRSLVPDIVLTDIRMPNMDGLEMTRIIRKEFPHIKILILSVLEDFPYVQEALRLGVVDYMQKLLMRPEELLDALLKIKQLIQSDHAQHAYDQTYTIQHTIPSYEFWEWLNDRSSHSDSNQNLSTYLLGKIQVHSQDQDKPQITDYQALLTACFSSHIQIDTGNDPDGNVWFLLSADTALELANTEERLLKHINNLEQSSAISIGLSEIFYNISERDKALPQVGDALQQRFFNETGSVFRYDPDLQLNKMDGHFISREDLKQYLLHLEGTDDEKSIESLHELLPEHVDASASPQWIRDGIYQWLSALIQLLEDWGCFLQGTFQKESPYNQVSKIQTYAELRDWCFRVHTVASEMLSKTRANHHRTEIIRAIEYIKSNYNKAIRVQDVAQWVNLSENYFSYLFTKETGKPYIQFLQETRIENAQALLRNSGMNWIDVGEAVGFDNPKYFAKVFKKYTNQTPLQYSKSKLD